LQTFVHCQEAEYATEACKASGKPVAMCIGEASLKTDYSGIPLEECAVRLAKAGKRILKFSTEYLANELQGFWKTETNACIE